MNWKTPALWLCCLGFLLSCSSSKQDEVPGGDAAGELPDQQEKWPDSLPEVADDSGTIQDRSSDTPGDKDNTQAETETADTGSGPADNFEGPDFQADGQGESCPQFEPPVPAGVVQSDQVVEASGLVASRQYAGVLWTHNDSGDSARFFALDEGGEDLGEYELAGANAYDWEDMALGPGPVEGVDYLLLADIGDNAGARDSVTIFRVAEPVPGTTADGGNNTLSQWDSIELVYPDGAHDAEAFISDPESGDWLIVTKVMKGECGVYHAAYPQELAQGPMVLEHSGALAFEMATAADISPDGSLIVVRSYVHAEAWPRMPGTSLIDALFGTPCPVPLAPEFQGETVAFSHHGKDYFTLSEGTSQTVWKIADGGEGGN